MRELTVVWTAALAITSGTRSLQQPPVAADNAMVTFRAELESETRLTVLRQVENALSDVAASDFPRALSADLLDHVLDHITNELLATASFHRLVHERHEPSIRELIRSGDAPWAQFVGLLAQRSIDRQSFFSRSVEALVLSDQPVDHSLLLIGNAVANEADWTLTLTEVATAVVQAGGIRRTTAVQLFGFEVLPRADRLLHWFVRIGQDRLGARDRAVAAWILLSVLHLDDENIAELRAVLDRWDGEDPWERVVLALYRSASDDWWKHFATAVLWAPEDPDQRVFYDRLRVELVRSRFKDVNRYLEDGRHPVPERVRAVVEEILRAGAREAE